MLRYQFWGFTLGVFALYARSLVESGDVDTIALAIVGGGGFLGGALGMVLAQRWKDRVPPDPAAPRLDGAPRRGARWCWGSG